MITAYHIIVCQKLALKKLGVSITEPFTVSHANRFHTRYFNNTSANISLNTNKNFFAGITENPREDTLNFISQILTENDSATWSDIIKIYSIPTELADFKRDIINNESEESKQQVQTIENYVINLIEPERNAPTITEGTGNTTTNNDNPVAVNQGLIKIVSDIEGFYATYHFNSNKNNITKNYAAISFENQQLSIRLQSGFTYSLSPNYQPELTNNHLFFVLDNDIYKVVFVLKINYIGDNQIIIGSYINLRNEKVMINNKIIFVKQSDVIPNNFDNLKNEDFQVNSPQPTKEQEIIKDYLTQTANNGIIFHENLHSINDIRKHLCNLYEEFKWTDILVGCYYCYFSVDTKIVRTKARFYKDAYGKLCFNYETHKFTYTTLDCEIRENVIYITLERTDKPFRIYFTISDVSAEEVTIFTVNYLAVSFETKTPVSGIEIFNKQNTAIAYEKLETKEMNESKKSDRVEQQIISFLKKQRTNPISISVISDIHGLEKFNESDNTVNAINLSLHHNFNLEKHYEKTKWYLYSLHENKKYLMRSVLTIHDKSTVSLHILNEKPSIEVYIGNFFIFNDIMIINLSDTSKYLQIRIKVGACKGIELGIGYWLNTTDYNGLISGSVLIDSVDYHSDIQPELLKTTKETESVSDEIRRYFNTVPKNFNKSSVKIFSRKNLQFFHNEQDGKTRKEERIFYINNLFVSSPIFSFKSYEEFSALKEIIISIEKEITIGNLYWAGMEVDSDSFDKQLLSDDADKIISIFDNSKTVLAIVVDKNSTGVFVEIGMAISSGKQCLIFCRTKDDLPFLFRNISNKNNLHVSIKTYSSYVNIFEQLKKMQILISSI